MTVLDGAGPVATTGLMAAPRTINFTKLLLAAADLATIIMAMNLAYRLKSHVPGHTLRNTGFTHLFVAGVSLPLWTAAFAHHRLYRARSVANPVEEFRRLVRAVVVSTAAMAVVGFVTKQYVARGWLALTFVMALGLLSVERYVVRRIFSAERERGRFLRPVLIVGQNSEAAALGALLERQPELGYRAVGYIPDEPAATSPGSATVTTVHRTLEALMSTRATGVLVATTAVSTETSNRLARDLPDIGIYVALSSSLRDVASERLVVRSLGEFPMLHVEPVHRSGLQALAKRSFDVVGAATGLLLLAPFLIVIAVVIRLSSAGPVLFRQERLGKGGHAFEVLKFRTMVLNADQMRATVGNDASGPLFKARHDPRCTPVGRFLRRFSLDEIPQLWNVLRNDMSLVGPRPALAREAASWSPELHLRLRVKPGITGMWQVNGRADASFESYERLDLYYVENWSLTRDLGIIAKTLPAVVFARGAY